MQGVNSVSMETNGASCESLCFGKCSPGTAARVLTAACRTEQRVTYITAVVCCVNVVRPHCVSFTEIKTDLSIRLNMSDPEKQMAVSPVCY